MGTEQMLQRNVKPLLVKFGLALAFSLAGFLFSRLRTRRVDPNLPPSSPAASGNGDGNEVRSEGQRAASGDDLHTPPSRHSPRVTLTTAEKHDEIYRQRPSSDISTTGQSPSSGRSGDREGYLLPEFNDLVRELDFSGSGISPKKESETPRSDLDTPKSFVTSERDVYEQEIKHLRNMVRMLKERERNLEVQLLEYYGLKEQEAAVMELQNRLKINNMEAKFLCLKIESLQADNRRLEAQVADHAKVVADLEAARSKIRMLKKKLRSEAEQNREQILMLQKRVEKLQEQERDSAKHDLEVHSNLLKLKQLEHEVEELRSSNLRLQLENSELSQRLESTQILANCILEDPEAEALKRQSELLRRENESLTKEVEQLQADRCTDVEELVYLRWINACLRYELRNYQPPAGKTAARDLSKTLSPKSEEKAKQLILEYADGTTEKALPMGSLDFDSDQWSSSQASFLTDSGELDDSSFANSSTSKVHSPRKSKLFGKLRKLILGKEGHEDHSVSNSNRISSLERIEVFESGTGSCCDSPRCDSSSMMDNRSMTPSCLGSSRHSLDLQRLRSLKLDDVKDLERNRRNSDGGSTSYSKFAEDSQLNNEEADSFEKNELVKYAKALKDSRGRTSKVHRKSASMSACL
ncbi:protein CHUP1, chloroplastic [Punica granatum]|uniref:Uncharacterized protein n=2 Tax=Punica granatum TaxID=22663 RepID=A0A218WX17_PUNGR|nr:protein CHUP1, chloroplastic [Punica granatum]OWM77096.1 hypothetical protein CDL15_Pgr013187 [Punica granatum]PKI58507.1 hypothetical protein CRG98_021109 [Punica granatum]